MVFSLLFIIPTAFKIDFSNRKIKVRGKLVYSETYAGYHINQYILLFRKVYSDTVCEDYFLVYYYSPVMNFIVDSTYDLVLTHKPIISKRRDTIMNNQKVRPTNCSYKYLSNENDTIYLLDSFK